jgi:2-polyprenyl-3-methyl-5-hydroxy-6-metoxy-1,4-benzoquinol methylase
MPLRNGGYSPMEKLSLPQRLREDNHFQAHWYRHVAPFFAGMSVLDAGSGVGYGLPLLREGGATLVEGFDPLPAGDEVKFGVIESYSSASWDVVVAMDVIEHIPNDVEFLGNLLRVARRYVFISTPNWNVSKAANAYHVREYTPTELAAILSGLVYRVWMSDGMLVITTRPGLAADECGNNFGVLITKVG